MSIREGEREPKMRIARAEIDKAMNWQTFNATEHSALAGKSRAGHSRAYLILLEEWLRLGFSNRLAGLRATIGSNQPKGAEHGGSRWPKTEILVNATVTVAAHHT